MFFFKIRTRTRSGDKLWTPDHKWARLLTKNLACALSRFTDTLATGRSLIRPDSSTIPFLQCWMILPPTTAEKMLIWDIQRIYQLPLTVHTVRDEKAREGSWGCRIMGLQPIINIFSFFNLLCATWLQTRWWWFWFWQPFTPNLNLKEDIDRLFLSTQYSAFFLRPRSTEKVNFSFDKLKNPPDKEAAESCD